MSTSPADVRRLRTERELLAIAKQLPVPVLSEERHEELRTALLASVSGGSASQLENDGETGHPSWRSRKPTALIAGQGTRRWLLVASILLAGAGIAAAAWRMKIRPAPALEGIEVVAADTTGKTRGGGVPALPEKSATPEQSPAAASGLATPVSASAPARPRPGPPRSTRRVAVGSTSARKSQAEIEIAFARGWTALRANDFELAAHAFGQAAAERDDNALTEDASFWRGVALDRANRLTEAREALTRFLVRYPKSDRVGEASVILGWLLLHAGDFTAADVRFGAALGDPSERVRRSARAGLAASGRRLAE